MAKKLTSDVLTERDTVTQAVTINGEEYEIEVIDITIDELEKYEKKERDDELSETELISELWAEFLVTPDHDSIDGVPQRKVFAVTEAMYKAWGAGDEDIQQAMEELETPGN